MICRVIGCDNYIIQNYPVDTDGMCERCWEEYMALQDAREIEKENDDALQDD